MAMTSATTLFRARRFTDARSALEAIVRVDSTNTPARLYLARTMVQLNDARAAVETLGGLGQTSRSSHVRAWSAYAQLSANPDARAPRNLLAGLTAQGDRNPDASYLMAVILGEAGDLDRAFESLERAVQLRAPSLIWLGVEPELDPLRSDPRFETILQQVGLTR